MSKYYKADNIINTLADQWRAEAEAESSYPPLDIEELKEIARRLFADLPTIEVSEDAISREYLEEQCWQTLISKEMINTDIDLGINIGIMKMHENIKDAPSVLPKEKEGEWVTKKGSYEIICSNCEYEAFTKEGEWFTSDYCWHCGARMKG